MQKITTFLWFDRNAEEAASFYISIFPEEGPTRDGGDVADEEDRHRRPRGGVSERVMISLVKYAGSTAKAAMGMRGQLKELSV